MRPASSRSRDLLYKDEVLNRLSNRANVAQFGSVDPNLVQRYCRIRGSKPNYTFADPRSAVRELLSSSPEGAINIRSFRPEEPQGAEFVPNLNDLEDIVGHLRRLASKGLHTIVNELVDVNDGGVSGVLQGQIIEFAPGETPRCVEGSRIVSLPRGVGLRLLKHVYGFQPALRYPKQYRVEFSLHPKRRGFANEHTIIWELDKGGSLNSKPLLRWPNAFSRLIGDKAFGLLIADLFQFKVPATLVISRKIAPFTFGDTTGTFNKWIRTCPAEPKPGFFPTTQGWVDPFELLSREDPAREIASVLVQEEVSPKYSGGALTSTRKGALIEGVRGAGDRLMLGEASPEALPQNVINSVRQIHGHALRQFGDIRIEWVHDGNSIWLVQLQQEPSSSLGHTIVPGQARQYHEFNVKLGIEQLRELVARVENTDEGIALVGRVGMTSHLADILRRARIPSVLTEGESTTSKLPRGSTGNDAADRLSSVFSRG
jgi:hypothetical protein